MKPQKTTKTPQKPKRRLKNDRKKTHTKTSMLQNITKPYKSGYDQHTSPSMRAENVLSISF